MPSGNEGKVGADMLLRIRACSTENKCSALDDTSGARIVARGRWPGRNRRQNVRMRLRRFSYWDQPTGCFKLQEVYLRSSFSGIADRKLAGAEP